MVQHIFHWPVYPSLLCIGTTQLVTHANSIVHYMEAFHLHLAHVPYPIAHVRERVHYLAMSL